MASDGDDAMEGFEILGCQSIEFADQNVQRMRNRERDVGEVKSFCPRSPTWAVSKTQLKTGLQVKTAVFFVQLMKANQGSEVFVIFRKKIDIAAEQTLIDGHLEWSGPVERDRKGAIGWQQPQKLAENLSSGR